MHTAVEQWTALITTAFKRRIRADQLTDALREQWSKTCIPGTVLVSLILTSGAPMSGGVDPLIPAYVNEVLAVTDVDVCDVLISLLSHSRYAIRKTNDKDGPKPLEHDLLLLESIFSLLLRLLVSEERPRTPKESRRAVRALAEWVAACNYHETILQVHAEGLQAPEPSVISALETVGTFAVSLLTNRVTRRDFLKSWSKGLKSLDKLVVVYADNVTRSQGQVCFRHKRLCHPPHSVDIL